MGFFMPQSLCLSPCSYGRIALIFQNRFDFASYFCNFATQYCDFANFLEHVSL